MHTPQVAAMALAAAMCGASCQGEVRIDFSGTGKGTEKRETILSGPPLGMVGWDAIMVGDMDGDGLAEVAAGNRDYAAPGESERRGAVHIVYGRRTFPAHVDLGTTEATIQGDLISQPMKVEIAAPGDIDGDGLADLIVTLPSPLNCSPVGRRIPWEMESYAGVFVIYGGRARLSGRTSLGAVSAKIAIDSPCADTSYATAALGDIDGDGLGDFAVAFPGSADDASSASGGYIRLVYGDRKRFAGTVALAAAGGELRGAADGRGFAELVRAAGDVDGDGYADFLVRELFQDPARASLSARVYLVRGGATRLSGATTLAGTTTVFRPRHDFGFSMTGLGDIDGDGVGDLAIVETEPAGSFAKIFYGRRSWPAELFTSDADASVGPSARLVAAGGDLDGDGRDDWLSSDQNADGFKGIVYLISGSSTRLHGSLTLATIAASVPGPNPVIVHLDSQDVLEVPVFGTALAGGHDVDGDGLADVVVGVPGNIVSGNRGGEVHMLLRRPPLP